MKILIIGKTKSGKTTFGQNLANKLNYEFHSMSEMFRNLEKDNKLLTNNSLSLLQEDWNCNINYIQNKFNKKIEDFNDIHSTNGIGLHDNIILEGFRNPYEFFKFLDQNTHVIILNKINLDYKDNFEKEGLEAILSSLKFLQNQLGFKYKKIFYHDYEELNKSIELSGWKK